MWSSKADKQIKYKRELDLCDIIAVNDDGTVDARIPGRSYSFSHAPLTPGTVAGVNDRLPIIYINGNRNMPQVLGMLGGKKLAPNLDEIVPEEMVLSGNWYAYAHNFGHSRYTSDGPENVMMEWKELTLIDGYEGPELITNAVDRDFSGECNWDGVNWEIVDGAWTHNTAAVNSTLLLNEYLNDVAEAGKSYQITATIKTTQMGTLTPSFGGVSGDAVGQTVGTLINYTWIVTAINAGYPTFIPDIDWKGSVDNISIIERNPLDYGVINSILAIDGFLYIHYDNSIGKFQEFLGGVCRENVVIINEFSDTFDGEAVVLVNSMSGVTFDPAMFVTQNKFVYAFGRTAITDKLVLFKWNISNEVSTLTDITTSVTNYDFISKTPIFSKAGDYLYWVIGDRDGVVNPPGEDTITYSHLWLYRCLLNERYDVWSAEVDYEVDAVVFYELKAWKSLQHPNLNQVPAETEYWTEVFVWKDDPPVLDESPVDLFAGTFIKFGNISSLGDVFNVHWPIPPIGSIPPEPQYVGGIRLFGNDEGILSVFVDELSMKRISTDIRQFGRPQSCSVFSYDYDWGGHFWSSVSAFFDTTVAAYDISDYYFLKDCYFVMFNATTPSTILIKSGIGNPTDIPMTLEKYRPLFLGSTDLFIDIFTETWESVGTGYVANVGMDHQLGPGGLMYLYAHQEVDYIPEAAPHNYWSDDTDPDNRFYEGHDNGFGSEPYDICSDIVASSVSFEIFSNVGDNSPRIARIDFSGNYVWNNTRNMYLGNHTSNGCSGGLTAAAEKYIYGPEEYWVYEYWEVYQETYREHYGFEGEPGDWICRFTETEDGIISDPDSDLDNLADGDYTRWSWFNFPDIPQSWYEMDHATIPPYNAILAKVASSAIDTDGDNVPYPSLPVTNDSVSVDVAASISSSYLTTYNQRGSVIHRNAGFIEPNFIGIIPHNKYSNEQSGDGVYNFGGYYTWPSVVNGMMKLFQLNSYDPYNICKFIMTNADASHAWSNHGTCWGTMKDVPVKLEYSPIETGDDETTTLDISFQNMSHRFLICYGNYIAFIYYNYDTGKHYCKWYSIHNRQGQLAEFEIPDIPFNNVISANKRLYFLETCIGEPNKIYYLK